MTRLYFENRQPEKLIQISEKLLDRTPDDKDALLFCGLGYQALGKEAKAYEYYARALDQMEVQERRVMEATALIATSKEHKMLVQNTIQEQEDFQEWLDTPEYIQFWREQDPLFLTDYNERRMEHYGRVAYANLSFGRQSKGLQGWQTDRGEAYIKFGRYLFRRCTWPEVDARGILTNPQLEIWYYEDFKITFRNWNGLDAWRFDTTYRDQSAVRPGTEESSGLYVFERTLPRYVDPYLQQKYSLPHQVVAFHEGHRVRLEVSYALPRNKVLASEQDDVTELENGIFLFDEHWKEVYKKRLRVNLKWPPIRRPSISTTDSLGRNWMFFYRTLYCQPGSLNVVAEVWDARTKTIGTFQERRTFSPRDSVLEMSDLLIASQIEPKSSFPESRQDLEISLNPLLTFGQSEPVFLYFEVYGLKRNAFEQTDYEISYKLSRPEKEEIDPALFVAMDLPEAKARVELEAVEPDEESGTQEPVHYQIRYVLPQQNKIADDIQYVRHAGKEIETTVTAHYEGSREDDFTYLQVDITQVPPGIHRLTVSIKDLLSGRTVSRSTLFRAIE